MDGRALGDMLFTFLTGIVGFSLCTLVVARILAGTRLSQGKVMIAAMFLGHLVAALFLSSATGTSEASSTGSLLSRILALPLLYFGGTRLVNRWRAQRSAGSPVLLEGENNGRNDARGEPHAADPHTEKPE